MSNESLKFSGLNLEFFLAVALVFVLCILFLLSDYPWLFIFPLLFLYRLIEGSIREIIFREDSIVIQYILPRKRFHLSHDKIERIVFDYAYKLGYHSKNKLRIKTPAKKVVGIDLDADKFEYEKVALLLSSEVWKNKIIVDASKEVLELIDEQARKMSEP
jgi:hypothetical protein